MISIKKVNTLFVLLLLLFSMIPVAVADPGIEGTDEKIDILYIGWVDDGWTNMKIAEDMALYYEDDFSIVLCDFYDLYGMELTEE